MNYSLDKFIRILKSTLVSLLVLLLIFILFPSFKNGFLSRDLVVSTLSTISSSIISTIGVVYTIKYTKDQFDKDKKIQVKPRPNILLKANSYKPSNILGERFSAKLYKYKADTLCYKYEIYPLLYLLSDDENVNVNDITHLITGDLTIENLGLGHIMNCKITSIRSNKRYIKTYPINSDNNILFIGNIKSSNFITIKLTLELEPIYLEEFYDQDSLKYIIDEEISITIEYEDILYNKYTYEFPLEIFLDSHSLSQDYIKIEDIKAGANILYDKCEEKLISLST